MNFEANLKERVKELGGWINAHSHLDRAYIMDSKYVQHADIDPWEISTYPLPVKQHIMGKLHSGLAYTKDSLKERITKALTESIKLGVKQIYSCIDTTADRVGISALEVALNLKEEYKDQIDFQVGAYPMFGFEDRDLSRWEVFRKGAMISDFIVTLPERDARQNHIGFEEHFRRVINFASDIRRDMYFHLDQTNCPEENGTETLIEAVKWLKPKSAVWAVHSLSIASYDEDRFQMLLHGMKEANIGVIVCPNATLSNKQNRNVKVPMHNSITRVLELLLADIPVRIGTDNIEDFFCPENTADMYDEVKTAARALRFYNTATWAKVVCGVKLDQVDKMKIQKALDSK